jgi:hypothetical protein
MQVQTIIGENVIATVMAEPVIRTVTQDAIAVTLWETVEEGTPEATPQATPPPEVVEAIDEIGPGKEAQVDGH